ncbi:phosphatase PAP2 family protein [Pendulispora albinea]|uniref:Phosphatase PAP2 family protein n=1 Tax=Pendulispora albinea TaxID=2741071 RepID=A0ABZ2LT53_9BACT
MNVAPPRESGSIPTAAWRHIRALWPRWTWWLPPVPFVLDSIMNASLGALRWDHILILVVVVGLAYGNAFTKKLCVGLYPMGLVALLYDSMRLVQHVGIDASTVHLCDLRALELRWFGLDLAGTRITLHDYFQQHASLGLDVLCAIPYGTFLFYCIAFSGYLFMRDFRAMQRFTWGWLALNVIGFTTYHLYPAAPPWYFHTHGCAVDLFAKASEGPNLARVDALFGMTYFHGLYGRASDVFGAVPSLHVAYPLLVVLEGWSRFRTRGRAFTLGFFLLMCFSAIYLDHHWVIDVMVGLTYAIFTFGLIRVLGRVLRRPGSDDGDGFERLEPASLAGEVRAFGKIQEPEIQETRS